MSDLSVLQRINPSQAQALADVVGERLRQDAIWGPGIPDEGGMLAVLMEEVGEVANEILILRNAVLQNRDATIEALRDELIQVAAVAVKWVEGIDAECAGKPLPVREAK